MRWAQLVLVENDPGRFDLAFWLDYFRRVHADAACLSAGGIVAYYPTDVPFHHRSAWLGTSDPFGELVRGCRAMGMKVIARTDPHATRDDTARAHPDWIAVDADGQAAPPLGQPGAVGHLRARPLQLRVHDRGPSRDRVALRHRRHLHQPLGQPDRLLLRALPPELPRRHRARPAAHDRRRRSGAPRLSSPGARPGSPSCGTPWDADIRRTRPGACFVPNGPPDMRDRRGDAGRPSSSPITRRGAA